MATRCDRPGRLRPPRSSTSDELPSVLNRLNVTDVPGRMPLPPVLTYDDVCPVSMFTVLRPTLWAPSWPEKMYCLSTGTVR